MSKQLQEFLHWEVTFLNFYQAVSVLPNALLLLGLISLAIMLNK